jgi:phosphate transport system permease protein
MSNGSRVPFGSRARVAAEGARAATLGSLQRQPRRVVVSNRVFRVFLYGTVAIALIGLMALLVDAFVEGQGRLSFDLITDSTSRIADNAGFRQAILGSLYLVGLMILMVIPLGVGAALYMEEYGKRESRLSRLIEVNIQNLAAVPAIVYGILGLAFIVRGPLDLGFMLFAGSITLTLLVLPTVIIAAREAIRAVPPSIREGSLALGATQWQTIRHQVLPAALPGILTGVILAVSRALGEAAPLLLFGAAIFVTTDPQPFNSDAGWTALPVQIFSLAADPQAELRELAAAGIIIMLAVLLLMNSFAIWLRNRYEHKW